MKPALMSGQFVDLPETIDFPSAQSAARALAAEAAQTLRDALEQREMAVLVVPGGRSATLCLPPLFDRILDWNRVRVFLTDERWVPTSSPESNETLVRGLMDGRPASQARLTGFWQPDLSATAASRSAAGIIESAPHPIDLVICGMGDDGHVASIFPGPIVCNGCADDTVVVSKAPKPPRKRVTLTMKALTANRRLLIPITGASKRAVYRSLDRKLPIFQLLQTSLGRVTIFADGLDSP